MKLILITLRWNNKYYFMIKFSYTPNTSYYSESFQQLKINQK